jgi:hypothetical protein
MASSPKNTFYFSHDANAFFDPKIRILISEYGIIAYAVFWIIVEMLSAQKDFKIPLDGFVKSLKPLLQGKHLEYSETVAQEAGYYDDENNKVDTTIVGCHRIELAYATALFQKMFDVELFEKDSKYFWSKSLNERMLIMANKSEIGRDNAMKRWHPKAALDNNNAVALPELCSGIATPMPTQCFKGKERKGKYNKEINKESDAKELKALDKKGDFNIFEYYEKYIGKITQSLSQKLIDAEEEYTTQWVAEALEIGRKKESCSWTYIEVVLKNAKKVGLSPKEISARGNGHTPKELDEEITKILDEIEIIQGHKFAYRNREYKEVQHGLSLGYTSKEILGCRRAMQKDEWWQKRPQISIMKVVENIEGFKQGKFKTQPTTESDKRYSIEDYLPKEETPKL